MKRSLLLMASLFLLAGCGGGGHSGSGSVSSPSMEGGDTKGGITKVPEADAEKTSGQNSQKATEEKKPEMPESPGVAVTQPQENPVAEGSDGQGEGVPLTPVAPGDEKEPVSGNESSGFPGEGETGKQPGPGERIPLYEGDVVTFDKTMSYSSMPAMQKTSEGISQKAGYVIFNIKGTDVTVSANSSAETSDITEMVLSDKNTIEKFIDENTNALVGYYGKVLVNTKERSDSGTFDPNQTAIMLYSMDSQFAKKPEVSAKYNGKFYYYFEKTPQEAAVTFDYREGKVTGDIQRNESEHWKVQDRDNHVSEDGKFTAKLESQDKTIKNGTLKGGFYGSHGEFLVGEAKSEDDGQQWGGIMGARRDTGESRSE
ncbi:hypothetical protein DEI68_23285 [Salmonella enterica subsp. enterica serovar Poona]|nr:hypothetical protein [Salmonella enterica]EEM7113328.1 hypothetical protein [Salmonella enterica subsp. enterica serovar Poona]EEO3567701.1 hypothetical protein [Salmonella enterica subsp. enterica serovar Poona]EHZ8150102.1 hypothetical protein [Salmonella enterica]